MPKLTASPAPGPWFWDEETGRVNDANGHELFHQFNDLVTTDEEAAASCQLAAAAPDMFEALNSARLALMAEYPDPQESVIDDINAALAKATERP